MIGRIFFLSLMVSSALQAEEISADVIVYGGTPAGIAAAVQTSRMGSSVVLLEPGPWIGGMMTGGLGATDKGVTWTVGGLARDFFQRIFQYYSDPAVWKRETRETYLPKHGQTHTAAMGCQWYFEPHVAREIFNRMLAEANVPLRLGEHLNRKDGLKKEGGLISQITMESGLQIRGKYFIDATYEGDLMAAAGVEYFVGREANSKYAETLNGIQVKPIPRLSPYVEEGDPKSGLLPRIASNAPGRQESKALTCRLITSGFASRATRKIAPPSPSRKITTRWITNCCCAAFLRRKTSIRPEVISPGFPCRI